MHESTAQFTLLSLKVLDQLQMHAVELLLDRIREDSHLLIHNLLHQTLLLKS